MRILLVNACHFQRGGSETVYFSTGQLLSNNGHAVAYFSTKDPRNISSEYDKYFISNANFREFSLLKKIIKAPSYLFNLEASKKLEQLICDFKPDIAHVHIFYAALSVSILKTFKKHKIPVIHTVHDYRLLCPVNTFIDNKGAICEFCMDKHYYHCLVKKCSDAKLFQSAIVMLEAYFWKYFISPYKFIDHFIFVSNFVRDKHLVSNSDLVSKSTRIYNFSSIRNSDNKILKGEYFLFFGRLTVEKGIDTLIKVFSKEHKFRLKIAGLGPMSGLVEESAKSYENIEYEGFRGGKELYDLIMGCIFVIVPSIWYENNPMAIIESLSLGKPVIGSDIGGIPELIIPEKTGFLFEHNSSESLASIIERASSLSESEYIQYSKACKKYADDNFNPEKYYEDLMKVYMDIIN